MAGKLRARSSHGTLSFESEMNVVTGFSVCHENGVYPSGGQSCSRARPHVCSRGGWRCPGPPRQRSSPAFTEAPGPRALLAAPAAATAGRLTVTTLTYWNSVDLNVLSE